MWGFFGHKKKVENLEKEISSSFAHVKSDLGKVGEWIQHIDGKHETHSNDIETLKEQFLLIQGELIEIKELLSFFGPQLSKQTQTGANKQTGGVPVQTAVQTAVQTGILEGLTVMERAIVWALLNSEMNLSYEDLSTLLGKNKSTIRGQINGIKQKKGELIKEFKEVNGKKRLYIPENTKNSILKDVKIRVKKEKNRKSES